MTPTNPQSTQGTTPQDSDLDEILDNVFVHIPDHHLKSQYREKVETILILWANKRAEARVAEARLQEWRWFKSLASYVTDPEDLSKISQWLIAAEHIDFRINNLTTKTNTLEQSAKGTPFEGFFEGDNLVDKTNKATPTSKEDV